VRRFGELEAEVMKRLWARSAPTTVREIVDELQRERPIAYTTVMTVMDNLFKKDWLHRHLDGRAYRYEPATTREQYSAELMRDALDTSGDRTAALAHFLEQLSPEEARALRDAVREAPQPPTEIQSQPSSGPRRRRKGPR
jgi:predicted transcriptional regulator